MKINFFTWLFLLILLIIFTPKKSLSQNHTNPQNEKAGLVVKKTADFTVSGYGDAKQWNQTEWVELTQRTNHERSSGLVSKMKVLYSEKGLYVLFNSEDKTVSATIEANYEELWREDVVEVFLWPDESEPNYFEYEISPLNYELPLLVLNKDGEQMHWIPFEYSYYEGHERKVIHQTSVTGGEKVSGAEIDSWTAEFFIPFELLHPLKNIYPESGTKWRANFYRLDYDDGSTAWSWKPYTTNFHDYENYGTLIFE